MLPCLVGCLFFLNPCSGEKKSKHLECAMKKLGCVDATDKDAEFTIISRHILVNVHMVEKLLFYPQKLTAYVQLSWFFSIR